MVQNTELYSSYIEHPNGYIYIYIYNPVCYNLPYIKHVFPQLFDSCKSIVFDLKQSQNISHTINTKILSKIWSIYAKNTMGLFYNCSDISTWFFLLKMNLINNILHLLCNIHYLLSCFIQGHTNCISVGLNIYVLPQAAILSMCHRSQWWPQMNCDDCSRWRRPLQNTFLLISSHNGQRDLQQHCYFIMDIQKRIYSDKNM